MTIEHWNTDQTILRRAHDELIGIVDTVTDDARHLPSPCPPWTVDDVIDHLIGGATMTIALLGGSDGNTAVLVRDAWTGGSATPPGHRAACALERTAFEHAAPDDAVDHPLVAMTAAELLGLRIIEYAVHMWDIRRSMGDLTPLDATLAGRAWELAAPLAAVAADLGAFGDGPSGQLPVDASDEARLVDVTGRRSAVLQPNGTSR